jgi:hybrid cluster-associated redox disulfide protein
VSEDLAIADMTVERVLVRWPETADVFGRHNMACIGCPVAPFYSVSEAAAVYKLPVADFVTELEEAITGGAKE